MQTCCDNPCADPGPLGAARRGLWLAASLLLSLLGLCIPGTGEAQQATTMPRIGYVSTNVAGNQHTVEAFRQGLRDLGYVEGHNIVIDYRSAEGHIESFPTLMADLVALKVDVIVAANTRAALAAQHATSTIPIVFAGPTDPVTSGLVTSLARPGGNVTGLASTPGPELVGKALEQLTQAVPGVKQVAALWHRDYPAGTQQDILTAAESAARALGIHLQLVEVRGGPEDFERAFAELSRAGAQALTVLPSVLFASSRKPLVKLAANYRLPTVYPVRNFVDEGGLMSYGPLWVELYRRAATYVDKILKGAKPSDLPVEQPRQFELIINLKTAAALGLTLPATLLFQADEVLQ